MSIPIRNIYYLLLYAWDHLEERDDAHVRDLQSTEVAELFGRVLHGAITRIFRKGLDRNYLPTTDTLAGVRGSIEISATLTRDLLRRGQTVCTFDELTADTLPNRIVKAAAERVLAARQLDHVVADLMRECVRLLRPVRSVPLTSRLCRHAQLHQNNRAYRLPLAVAELLAANSLVDEHTGAVVFRDFARADGPMARLFQAFVKNFLKREQNAFVVRSPALGWTDLVGAPAATALVPGMFTDVCLESPGQTTVIETKYYRDPFAGHYGVRRIPSAHLYQLYAYVNNLALTGVTTSGVLLYAQPGEPIDAKIELQGHRMRVMTLDLSADWQEIAGRLLELTAWARNPVATVT